VAARDAPRFAAEWCAIHQSAPRKSWPRIFPAARIPIRPPAVAATDDGRRAAGRAAGKSGAGCATVLGRHFHE